MSNGARRAQDELELVLYGRPWCHLCDEMADALAPIAERFGARMIKVNVDDDPMLEARFGLRIPVLVHGEHELAEHRLDTVAVESYLEALRASRPVPSA